MAAHALAVAALLVVALAAALVIKGKGPLMHTVYVVETEPGKPPLFPDLCPICLGERAEAPGAVSLTSTYGRLEYYLYGYTKPYPGDVVLQVPAHEACLRSVRNGFALKLLVILAAVGLVVAVAIAAHWGGFVAGMLGLVLFGMLLSFETSKPMPMEFCRFTSGKYGFLMRDKGYAEIFAKENHSTVKEGTYLHDYSPE